MPIAALAINADALLAIPAAYGNGGSVTIGNGAQTVSRVVGSAQGTTSVAGQAVLLNGSNSTTGAFAQIGFNEELFRLGGGANGLSSSGNIRVLTGAGGLSLAGGSEEDSVARVGHGGQFTASASMTGDIIVDLGEGALNLQGGSGARSTAMIGHGGHGSQSQKGGAIRIKASEINLVAGNGDEASAKLGHGGLRGAGSISGSINLDVLGDINLLGGNGTESTAQIGFAGNRYKGSVSNSNITTTAGGTLILNAGAGLGSTASIGHGGFNSSNSVLSGDINVAVGETIQIEGGTGNYASAQIGSGNGWTDSTISGNINVAAGNSIYLSSGSTHGGSYGKIGHGDAYTADLSYFSGTGSRSGNILVGAGQDISLTGAMIGHVNAISSAVAAPATTTIAVSRDNPEDPNGGSLSADSASEFSGSSAIRFYLPTRANNRISQGAILNGMPYAGPPSDPSLSRDPNEYAVSLTGTRNVVLNEHTNIPGSGPDPGPGGVGFYYNTIAINEVPVIIPPVVIPPVVTPPIVPPPVVTPPIVTPPVITPPVVVTPPDPETPPVDGMRDDLWSLTTDDELLHDHERRRRKVRRSKSFTISYEGYTNYSENGDSLFDYSFNNAPESFEAVDAPESIETIETENPLP